MQEEEKVEQLKEAIAQLKARFPKHSVPPAMIIELEELEEELERAMGEEYRDRDRRFVL